MSLVRGLTEVGAKAVKKTAPFYSAVDEALSNLKRPKGTGIEFLTEVMKQPGVKKAEIADRKLEEAFKAKGKMTKEEAQQVLKENPPPKVREKVYDETTALDEDEIKDIVAQEMYGLPYDDVTNQRQRSRVYNEAMKRLEQGDTKYGDYRTHGGENYREILLKLPPNRPNAANYTDPAKYDADLRSYNITGKGDYYSNHWEDDPNVLAHMRVQDRLIEQPPQKGFYAVNKKSGNQSAMFDTPEELQAYIETLPESIRNNLTMAQGERKVPPKKVLQVEEIQSDWHQAGRTKGYKPNDYIEQSNALDNEFKDLANKRGELFNEAERIGYRDERHKSLIEEANSITPRLAQLQEQRDKIKEVISYGVPDAPFKKNWHELAMKRLLNYAAENGYDSIDLTPGVEHFNRYGSERIDWKKGDDGWTVGAREQFDGMHGGENIENLARERGVLLERHGDQVKSKEDLQRILNVVMRRQNTPEQIEKLTNRVWDRMQTEAEGTSLPRKEGMEGFYDKILPDYLNSFGKPYGAQVELNKTPVSTRHPMDTSWGGGQGDHPFITVQDLNEPFEGMVELMRRDPETGEETLVGRMRRAESERRMAEELQKLDKVNQIKLHSFPITPEMRESIKQKGLPLYQQIGIPTAGAGAASQATQEEPEYGVGGSVAKMAALAKLQKLKEEMAPRAAVVKDLMAKDSNQYLRDVTPDVLTNDYIEQEIARMKAKAEASKPEVKLADGGAINFNTAPDMSDGGRIMQGAPFKRGGKVNMTANRDTMFMELSNKKLKRK